MSEEEKQKIIKGLEWSQQQMRLGNLPNYDKGHYADVDGALNYIDRLQKENDNNYLNYIKEKNKADKLLVHYNKEKENTDRLQKENKLMEKELDKCSKHILPCMFETSKEYVSKDKIKETKEKTHWLLDKNGITRAYQLEVDRYFEELLKEN